jgi:hypothetical protein
MHHHNLLSIHTWFPSSRVWWLASQSWRSLEWIFDNSQPTQGNFILELLMLVASNPTHLVPCWGPPRFLLVISRGPRMAVHQSRTHTCWTCHTAGALIVVEAWHKGVPHALPYPLSIPEYHQWIPRQTYPAQAWKLSSWDTWSVPMHLLIWMTWQDTHTGHIL